MVPRTARRGFSEPHSSVMDFDGGKRGRAHQFCEAVAFEEVFMVGCVSPIAGISSCDSVSDIIARTVTKCRCVWGEGNVTELLADPSNLALSVVHETATALFAHLPPQHRRPMSGKGSGGSCLSRHRVQCAGADTELLLTVSITL